MLTMFLSNKFAPKHTYTTFQHSISWLSLTLPQASQWDLIINSFIIKKIQLYKLKGTWKMLKRAWAAARRPMVREASTATWTARASRKGSGQTPLLDLILLREDEGPASSSPPWVEDDEEEVDMFGGVLQKCKEWKIAKISRQINYAKQNTHTHTNMRGPKCCVYVCLFSSFKACVLCYVNYFEIVT